MGISGIVAEFNPLHNGHKYLIDRAKSDGNTVVCVISGNFVQRGDTAIIPKFSRTKMALEAGADMVIELPTPWSMSTAQNFAFGAVSQLLAFGIDSLYFGSESANIDEILAVCKILQSGEYNTRIAKEINSNSRFSALRSKIVSDILGYTTLVLDNPNDTLAVEYILAANRLGAKLRFIPVKRIGANHNDSSHYNEFSNATLIRKAIKENYNEYLYKFMPKNCVDILLSSPISYIEKLDTAIISRLKLLKIEDFRSAPDISEGIENLIYNGVRKSTSFFELVDLVKTKRYTHARIRRLVLSAFLGIDKKYFGTAPPYVRVLGFKKEASALLNANNSKPLITRVAQIKELDDLSLEIFELENRINEIYALSLNKPELFVNEKTEKIVIK